jgi:hypothetical protein
MFEVDLPRVRTNMFFCTLAPDAPMSASALADSLRADAILVQPRGNGFRFVTHYWITPALAERVLDRVEHHLGVLRVLD